MIHAIQLQQEMRTFSPNSLLYGISIPSTIQCGLRTPYIKMAWLSIASCFSTLAHVKQTCLCRLYHSMLYMSGTLIRKSGAPQPRIGSISNKKESEVRIGGQICSSYPTERIGEESTSNCAVTRRHK